MILVILPVRNVWDQDISMKEQKGIATSKRGKADSERLVSRRAMLKGSATAMPAILTLQSGAALARSSNLIGTIDYKSPDRLGRTLCLDLDSVTPASSDGRVFDLRAPPAGPYAEVTAINERDYYAEANKGSAPVDESQICRDGITAFYKDGGWVQIDAPGGMVSVTALASFAAGSIIVTDL